MNERLCVAAVRGVCCSGWEGREAIDSVNGREGTNGFGIGGLVGEVWVVGVLD